MSFKKQEFLKLDLSPQRTSSYLSGRCGKISFHSLSFEEETPTKSLKSEDSTLKLYFNNFHPKILTNIVYFDTYFEISLPETSAYLIFSTIKKISIEKEEKEILSSKTKKQSVGKEFKSEKEIIFITIEKMIEILTSADEKNEEIFDVCLYGYLSFSDDETIFRELIRRFFLTFPLNMSKSEKSQIFFDKILNIQRRILAFLHFWIEIYKETIVLDQKLDSLFEETLNYLYYFRSDFCNFHRDLSKLLIKLEEVRVYKNFKKFNETNFHSFKNAITCSLKEIVFPINQYIMNHPKEIVEQICVFDFDNFYRISIPELLKKKKTGGENYNFFAKNFNNFSKIVSFLILSHKGKHKRFNFFEKIIEIIEDLIKMNNYNTAFAFFIAISHTAIERLKGLLLMKLSKKDKIKYEKFSHLFDSSNNNINLREAQRNMNAPCVPFLGIYVKDLLNFEENSKFNNRCTDKNMIDFRKSSQISALIREIDNYKEVWYEFQRDDLIYEHFKYLPDVPDDLLYELSYKIMPSI